MLRRHDQNPRLCCGPWNAGFWLSRCGLPYRERYPYRWEIVLHPPSQFTTNPDSHSWEGYQPRFQYNQLVPKLIGCSIPEDDNLAFAVPNNYTDAAIACNIGATPAPLSAPTQAGATVSLALNPWNPGHKGPVITFLANCQGPYKTIDPLALKFFKIEELSLLGQPDDQYR